MMMNGNSYYHHRHFSENLLDRFGTDVNRSTSDGFATIPASSSSLSSSPSPSCSSSSCSGLNYIEHRVSKMDTLAGVAIKYGVEVADIRRMNGLVTDLQMFALEILRIPRPGRHPPSPIVSNGTNGSATNGEPPRRPQDDVLESIQSLKLKPPRRVTPAMSSLQGYYGLAPPKRGPLVEGTEMAVYKTGRSIRLEDEAQTRASPASDSGFSLHRKSRSFVSLETAEMITEHKAVAEAGDSNDPDRSIRRRQKPDNDPSLQTPEVLRKEDGSGGFLGRIGKGLSLRPKTGSWMDGDSRQSTSAIGDFFSEVFVSVRKSSSTSNLQESESASSLWPRSKWSSKPDAIARPIFDGFPKPVALRRNKAAMD